MWISILLFHFIVILYGCVAYTLAPRTVAPTLRILVAAGTGPMLMTLMLFYLWWLVPGQSDFFYQIILFVLPGLVLAGAKFTNHQIVPNFQEITGTLLKKGAIVAYLIFLVGAVYYQSHKELTEHDALEYAFQGKIFYQDKSIDFVPHRFDDATGYYYIGLHGFGYPLLSSIDYLLSTNQELTQEIGKEQEQLFFFRYSSFFYGFLALLLVFFWLSRIDLRLGIAGTIFTLLTYGFLFNFLRYQLDTSRTFFLLALLILGIEILRDSSKRYVVLLGLLMGLQGMVHSIGIIFSGVWLAVLFLYLDAGFTDRIKWAFGVGATCLLAGGIHYVVDVVKGTGWVFRDIQFF